MERQVSHLLPLFPYAKKNQEGDHEHVQKHTKITCVYLFIVWRNDNSQRLCSILEKHVYNDVSTNILFLLFECWFIDNLSFGSEPIGYFSPGSASLRGNESSILLLSCVIKQKRYSNLLPSDFRESFPETTQIIPEILKTLHSFTSKTTRD